MTWDMNGASKDHPPQALMALVAITLTRLAGLQ
jgi:hypothetical protein